MATIAEKVANVGDDYLREIFGDFKTAQHYLNKYTFETLVVRDCSKGFPDLQSKRIDTTTCAESGEREIFITDSTSRMTSDERSLGKGDNYSSTEAGEWKESRDSILEPTRTGIQEFEESSLSVNPSTPLVAQAQPEAEFPESSSLDPSTPLVVQDQSKTEHDFHMSSPDSAHTPSTVTGDNQEISFTTVCSPQPKSIIAGMSTPINGQTEQIEQNLTPIGDSSLSQSPEAMILRRSKRKASHPKHKFDKDWSWKVPTKKLSKKINRSVRDLQGKFQVMPDRKEMDVGKLERSIAGEGEEPIVSRNERQTLEGQSPTSGDEILATQGQKVNTKRKRIEERGGYIKDKIVALEDLEPLKHKSTIAESEGTNPLEMRKGILQEGKKTVEQEGMRLTVEEGKQTIGGNYEKMTEDTEGKFVYDSPMLTSHSPRDCGTDQCIGCEDQIQTTEIRAEIRDDTEKQFDFHHEGERAQEFHSSTDQCIGCKDQIQTTAIRAEIRDDTEKRFDFHHGVERPQEFPCVTGQCIGCEDQIQTTEIRAELSDHNEKRFDFHRGGERAQLQFPRGTDLCISCEDQIQTTEIRAKLRDHTEKRFDFHHKGVRAQLDYQNKETTNIEASRESGLYDLPRPYHLQRCNNVEERKQNREQNNGTSRDRQYLQQYSEIGSDGHNHNQSHPQINESGSTVLETMEYRCNNTRETLQIPRNYNSSKEKYSYGDHNQTYIKYNSSDKAGHCCRYKHSSPREEKKQFNVFDKRVPDHEATLEKSYKSRVDLHQFSSDRKHRLSTGNRLRTLELEQENSRLREEVSYLKARLGVISKAVLKASETILSEAFAEVSEEEEEEEEELPSDTAVGESDEEYSFSCNEGDNDQLFRLYESFLQRGNRRRPTIRHQTFKSIKDKARQRTESSVAKRHIVPKFLASALKRKRYPQNLKTLD